jgi:hypothetical protein
MGDYIYQQCSGVRCQQAKSTRCAGVAHDMDFLSPMLAFSCNPISVQVSIVADLPPAENLIRLRRKTMNRFELWQSRSSLTFPQDQGFVFN